MAILRRILAIAFIIISAIFFIAFLASPNGLQPEENNHHV